MTGRNQHSSFQFTTTVQPPTGGYMYTLGSNSETEPSEEDGETFELRSRGKDRLRRGTSTDRKDDIVYLIRDIIEGDSLISISLQYFCTVADIKRANNLLTEQDFFALRSIRIPVKKFSLLTETYTTASLKTSLPGGTHKITEIPISETSLDSSSSLSSSVDSIECFLQEKDKDIELLVKSSAPSRSSLSAVVSSLEHPLLGNPDRKPVQKKDPYYGADWGMRWWTAVAIMLVVGIVTPVFYLLYYEVLMKADVSHHTTIDSLRSGPTQPAVADPLVLPQANAAYYKDSHLQPVNKQQPLVKHDEET